MKRFQSTLPNGSRGSRASSNSDYCILDCLYNVEGWTFYVLDILCWKGYSIVDCDTEFRHFWLQTKLDPSELDRPTSVNGFHKFIPLHRLPPTELPSLLGNVNEYVKQVLQREYAVDGLLFYHNAAKYTPGSTPLVCWAPLDQLGNLFLGQRPVANDTEMS
ncbi:hypothetical protein HELRODRAFT_184737 [Helobdella robusta]|uniref:Snurportin-1 n=3 Tax=Opisthokonta TaxID=33154 RepID=T1FLW4_HELRO|nr:hypothetical protein HELRODRAFT_184737 [Helobdella robusta]ESO01462.1 hypothetical protein HELRODRAFT_184737 [Helobdella robusta]